MKKMLKFGGQLEESVYKALKKHTEESGKKFSTVLNEAVVMYLKANRVRPEFLRAVEDSLQENAELYKKLAK